MKKRDVLTLRDLRRSELEEILALAARMRTERAKGMTAAVCAGKKSALVFEKPSLRTRSTFELGMVELGGHAMFMGPNEVNLGVRESPADCARVLSRLVDLIVVRTFGHELLEEMAQFSSVPVINALSDRFHPCQILADLLTLSERKADLEGLKIVFVGDGNNVVNSWLLAAEKFSFHFTLACPAGFEPDGEILESVRSHGARVALTHDVMEAARDADVLYTDVWASMGQEAEFAARRRAFECYQINQRVIDAASENVVIMHCLPAHRGEEITQDVLEGPHSIVFDQAENRLHAQKALMAWLLT